MKYTFSLFLLSLFLFSGSAQAQLQLINTIAGNGIAGFSGDGTASAGAELSGPLDVAVDSSGNVFINDYYNRRVRRVDRKTGLITTVAGNGGFGYTGDSSYAASAQINPGGLAIDKNGDLFISDWVYGVVRKVNKVTGIITTVVGSGVRGYSGDGGDAKLATMSLPHGITFDNIGNLYIADAGNHVVRMVDTFGVITTVAGDDTAGYMGDGAAATAARLDSPMAVAIDHNGNLYVTDYSNNVIRKVDNGGMISTAVGVNALPLGYSGDNGAATAAQLNRPHGIAVDYNGDLFIADGGNNRIRMVDTFGVIRTVVGNGTPGYGGDLGYVTGANLFNPYGVAVDYHGNIYIADANNERVRGTYFPGEAVKTVGQQSAIEVHPNPFGNQVNVSNLSKFDKLCVYDVVGRRVVDTRIVTVDGSQIVNLSDLNPGVYFLRVCDNEGANKAVIQLVKE